MNPSKTGLPAYQGEGTVYAGKITKATCFDSPGRPGCLKIEFAELGKVAHLLSDWVQANNPKVGGYFIVKSDGTAAYMPSPEFSGKYALVAKTKAGVL